MKTNKTQLGGKEPHIPNLSEMCSVFWKIIQAQKRPVHFLFILLAVNIESIKTEIITSENPL